MSKMSSKLKLLVKRGSAGDGFAIKKRQIAEYDLYASMILPVAKRWGGLVWPRAQRIALTFHRVQHRPVPALSDDAAIRTPHRRCNILSPAPLNRLSAVLTDGHD